MDWMQGGQGEEAGMHVRVLAEVLVEMVILDKKQMYRRTKGKESAFEIGHVELEVIVESWVEYSSLELLCPVER